MPTSVHYQISTLLDIVIALEPRSVLDIGAGTGKYGVLIREYLEMWNREDSLKKEDWKQRIDAIEAFEPYITPVHHYIYDNIFIGDVSEIIDTIDYCYDLIILVDVLEHIDKPKGLQLLGSLVENKAQAVLISLPARFVKQRALFGNPYEIHRAEWRKADFKQFGACSFVLLEDKLICLIGENAVKIWDRYRRRRQRRRLRKKYPLLADIYRIAHAPLRLLRNG